MLRETESVVITTHFSLQFPKFIHNGWPGSGARLAASFTSDRALLALSSDSLVLIRGILL